MKGQPEAGRERSAGAPLPALVIPKRVCTDYLQSSKLEWLETAGDGSFAMGTVAGSRTRRYHGLLVAALRPPVDRHVLLAGLDELVTSEVPGLPDLALSTQQYPNTLSPQGFTRLIEFRLDPFPTWVFDIGGAHLEKQLFLVRGEATVVVSWRATRKRRLVAQPFIAFRDYHSLLRSNRAWDGRVHEEQTNVQGLVLTVKPEAHLPALRLHAPPGAKFTGDGAWHYNAEVLEEQARGLDFQEDLYRMGSIALDLEPGRTAWLAATTTGRTFTLGEVEALAEAERDRRRARSGFKAPWVSTPLPAIDADPFRARLERAADQFVVHRQDGRPTVIAGYPWFTDWGRDTMLSLPGLLIARGRLVEARDVLRGFLAHLDRGLIPNRFPDRPGEPLEYNTVDATLWMFQAVFDYLRAGGDSDFLRDEFWPAAREIIRWHRAGTHHGIRVDPVDHLLAAGEPGVQLTWMDARVDGRVITPRHGKPVEINALWYNALRLMALWGRGLGHPAEAEEYEREAALVETSFERAFWNPALGHCNDVAGPAGPDASLRPNQLFAVSLPFPLLAPAQRRLVVLAVQRELLSPVGLRTLGPREPGYVARYQGGVAQRDSAYHQGTVWPWLLGPFVRAWLCAFGRTQEPLTYCRSLLTGLELRMEEGALGQVGEVYDGEAPHHAGGAPAQAWSVAELLHVLSTDLAAAGQEASAPRSEGPGRKPVQLHSFDVPRK